ncbi:MAG: response regulator [Oscillospiraceae bacterium]|jgi:putative two-component system response regulator|nr:response regulator [Oscillospiraceae bacterium]
MEESWGRAVVVAVDDDPIILHSILSILQSEYSVRPFPSGASALKYLRSNPADLIVLDYFMPEMTGHELLLLLQADPALKEIPVIFLTGSTDGDGEAEALEMGASDYLLKPIRPKALLTRVRLQLELQKHRRHLESLVDEKMRQLRQINRQLELRERTTMNLLARASDLRDPETGTHVNRTTEYVRIIVADLMLRPTVGYELTVDEGYAIVEAVKLHDIGKIAMPDSVLLKPGRLTPEEFEIIKKHPVYGEEMLHEAVEEMSDDLLLLTARDIAFAHHEKWDGSGYPRGLSGADIPLSARIAAVADVFDALTSQRPYKKPFPTRTAFDIIYKDAGAHFDPYIAQVVQRHERDFERVAREI